MDESISAKVYENLIGCTADLVMQRLPDLFPGVSEFSFVRYKPSEGVEHRLISHVHDELRRELADPSTTPKLRRVVTDLLPLVAVLHGDRGAALNQLLSHDGAPESANEFRVRASDLSQGALYSLVPTSQEQAIGLSSICRDLTHSLLHIPLLDFRLPPTTTNLEAVLDATRSLGIQKALVLESGRSYHVYGLSTLQEHDWRQLLVRALLLSPLIDVRYIAHRLLSGRGILRVSATLRKTFVPTVVAVI